MNSNPSPVKVLRTRLSLSQADLAANCGVTSLSILRLEQGCYPSILPSVADYISQLGFDADELNQEYQAWIKEERKKVGCLADEALLYFPVGNPLVYLRQCYGMNQIQFCKEFKVQTTIVSKFEKNEYRNVPVSLIEAFEDVGLTPLQIERFKEGYRALRQVA